MPCKENIKVICTGCQILYDVEIISKIKFSPKDDHFVSRNTNKKNILSDKKIVFKFPNFSLGRNRSEFFLTTVASSLTYRVTFHLVPSVNKRSYLHMHFSVMQWFIAWWECLWPLWEIGEDFTFFSLNKSVLRFYCTRLSWFVIPDLV